MIKADYKDWLFVLQRQCWYLPFVVLAYKKKGNVIKMFNAEGRTPEEAMLKAKDKADATKS